MYLACSSHASYLTHLVLYIKITQRVRSPASVHCSDVCRGIWIILADLDGKTPLPSIVDGRSAMASYVSGPMLHAVWLVKELGSDPAQ